MFKAFRSVAVTLAFGAALATPASASVINVTNVQVPYSESITLHGGILGGGNSEDIGIAGQIVLTTNIGTLGVWCVDLFHFINIGGGYTYTTGPLVTDNSGSSPATSNPLSALQIATIGKLAAYGNGVMATTPSSAFSAALQAAIWDTEYGTTATGSDPQFNTKLTSIFALLPSLPDASGYQMFNENADHVYQSQGQFVSQVPEPASVLLVGSGLAALGAWSRRRRKA